MEHNEIELELQKIETGIDLKLQKMKDEIISTVEAIITKSISGLEKYFNNLNKEKFDRINENIKRHDKYHEEHFKELKDLDEKITKSRDSILSQVKTDVQTKSKNTVAYVAIGVSVVAVIVSVILSTWPR